MTMELGKIEPINYARTISPILTKKCVPCHQSKSVSPTDVKYSSMEPYSFWFASAGDNRVAGHGGSRSKPGAIGARGSRMGKALLTATHQKALADGTYTDLDVLTLVQWLDIGSDELGAFDNQNAQRQGQLVWPSLDVDKDDPQGLTYKPETPYVARKDAGVAPDTALANGGTSGNAGAGGATTNGGQSGSTSKGGASGSGGSQGSAASGGKTGADGGAIGATASNGSGGSNAGPSSNASGGASGTSTTTSNRSSLGCNIGQNASAPAQAWFLLVVGIALLLRGRRR
jgi:MYXO-CTERM domain-containing protein